MSFFPTYGLPQIQTRKALLLLDFQNDFVRPSGALPVSNTADFLENLPPLAQAFRHVGDVIWVRTHFEKRRLIRDFDSRADRVVLAPRSEGKEKRKGGKSDEEQEEVGDEEEEEEHDKDDISQEDDEAFLSTDSPKCCLPKTAGLQFPAPILATIDPDSGDTVLDKSDYSALRSDSLVLSFRTRFITELYLCGSLSNVSVFATALDAARLGFAVTLVEDCLGFRDFERHAEAMRRMADIIGANGITTNELYEELEWQVTDAIARKRSPTPSRSVTPVGIEGDMDDLGFKTSPGSKPDNPPSRWRETKEPTNDSQLRRIAANLEDLASDDITGMVKYARVRYRRSYDDTGEGQAPAPEGRSRVRRYRRHEMKAESMSPAPRRNKRKMPGTYLGPGDAIGEWDSRIIHDLDLPPDAFEKIRDEVAWQKMYHLSGQVPRLVAVQGQCNPDGSIPIYRHPADEAPPLQPLTPTVHRIRDVVEHILGHPLNHVLIQRYRDGQDRISEHSDKTLDVVRGSSICNVSLGAQRVMVLRTKASAGERDDQTESGRLTQRVPLPHESLFILGEKTNMRWLHGIRPDKRPDSARSAEERAYGGERISLTFRHTGTFVHPVSETIWGQGAVSKSEDQAGAVIHGDAEETKRLIHAFGQENHATEFDWNAVYGNGFNVVNFVTASTTRLIPSGDTVADLRVRLYLGENGIRYEMADHLDSDTFKFSDDGKRPLYVSSENTAFAGDVDIISHLAQCPPTRPDVDKMPGGEQLPQIEELFTSWRDHQNSGKEDDFNSLDSWEQTFAQDNRHYLTGNIFGVDDCFLWPVLREIEQTTNSVSGMGYPRVHQYYDRVGKRRCVKAVLEEMGQS